VEAMKVMIHDHALPMFLWDEVCNIAVYVQNIGPHHSKEKRTKLEPSGKRGTFVGYNKTLKAYMIYVPGHRQIKVSRDVTFDEQVALRESRGYHMEANSEE